MLVLKRKLQTSGLQNKMCWKPLSKVNVLLGFFFLDSLVMTNSEFFLMLIMP